MPSVESPAGAVGGWRGEPPEIRRTPRDTWVFDTVHSSIHFSVRRMVVSRVHGQFTKWRGSMAFDLAHLAASNVSVRIDAGSIETGDARRDAHLRSSDFLHADRHPHIAFESTKIEPIADGQFAVTGVLEIRGVALPVFLLTQYRGLVRDRWGNDHVSFAATTRIDRAAFGLTWNDVSPTGELFVGGEIEISIEIKATRLPQQRS